MTADAFPHGSVLGYQLGCRSRGGCEYHGSAEYLTCVEASIASRGDFSFHQFAIDRAMPRPQPAIRPEPGSMKKSPPASRMVHGTAQAYARGCRDSRHCPNWRAGKITCSEARQRYVRNYHQRRLEGAGTPIEHGTSKGYLFGCRGSDCPGNDAGLTCRGAQAEYRRQRRQTASGESPRSRIPAGRAAKVLARLQKQGASVRTIAAQVGVCRLTVTRILDEHARGRAGQLLVEAGTEQKILRYGRIARRAGGGS